MRLSRAIQDYLNDCRRRRLSPATLRTYENSLGFLLHRALVKGKDEVGAFTEGLVAEYFASASDERHNAVETLLKKRVAVKQFAAWGLDERLWPADPTRKIPEYRKPRRLPRPFKLADRAALLDLDLPLAERALRAVLYFAGLRVSEVCALQVEDVQLGGGRPGRLRVQHGKGQRERIVPMGPELEAALGEYLDARRLERTSGGLDPKDFLFSRRGRPWTVRMVRYRARRWGIEAHVDGCTPHRWRHTAATELMEARVDVRAAQKFMGHASLETTMLYTYVADREVEEAVLQRSAMLARRHERRRDGATEFYDRKPHVGGEAAMEPRERTALSQNLYSGRGSISPQCSKHLRASGNRPPALSENPERISRVELHPLCRCGASAAEHALLVTADGRLVGASLVDAACEAFEAAA
jgi:integrase/recombinase XerC